MNNADIRNFGGGTYILIIFKLFYEEGYMSANLNEGYFIWLKPSSLRAKRLKADSAGMEQGTDKIW